MTATDHLPAEALDALIHRCPCCGMQVMGECPNQFCAVIAALHHHRPERKAA